MFVLRSLPPTSCTISVQGVNHKSFVSCGFRRLLQTIQVVVDLIENAMQVVSALNRHAQGEVVPNQHLQILSMVPP